MKTEYFIEANSFAAPFFSDSSTHFQTANSPQEALESFAKKYPHPAGLYAAACYGSATAFHKGEEPLARWLCNHAREKERLTKDIGSYSFCGHGPGEFEIDGVRHRVKNPKEGAVC